MASRGIGGRRGLDDLPVDDQVGTARPVGSVVSEAVITITAETAEHAEEKSLSALFASSAVNVVTVAPRRQRRWLWGVK